MPVPTNACCAWLTQAAALGCWRTMHKIWLGGASAAKGKIWQLEIATDACPPSSGKSVTPGCIRTQQDSLASATSGQRATQRDLALPDARPTTEIRASLCASTLLLCSTESGRMPMDLRRLQLLSTCTRRVVKAQSPPHVCLAVDERVTSWYRLVSYP